MSFALRTFALTLIAATSLLGQERMSPELLWKLGRLGGGVASPDGDWVAYTVRRYDLKSNKGQSDLFIVPTGGGKARQLTSGPESEGAIQWVTSKDGVRLYFLSRRGEGAKTQAWSLDPKGGEPFQVTDHPGGIANLKVAPTGDRIAFTADVKLDPTVADVYPDLPLADGRIIDGLMYRHWDSWHDYAYSHLHWAKLGADGKAGKAVDLMRRLTADCPVPPFGGSEQLAWSPDGKQIAYTAKIVNDWAESTDSDVYLVNVEGGAGTECITTGMDGYDNDPAYSPDGRFLLFHSMERPGFESDRNRVMLFDREEKTVDELTAGLDQTAHGATWTPDSKSVVFMSERRGTNQLFRLDVESKSLKQITTGRFNWSLLDVLSDGRFVVGRQNMLRPWEYGVLAPSGKWKRITDVNGDVYGRLELPKMRERWVRATDGKMIHNWVIYPPDFDPKKKWPVVIYCQGGPQGQIGQWFSYRWNFHLMAAQGYIVCAVNRRGLPGFGREWNDQISKDWGGQAMQDILSCTDDMLTQPYVDRTRVGAIGASFGGYTVYWLMGNSADRFACMISHAGVFNLESMYGSTEELFFVNWDLGGPYWKSWDLANAYERFSPHRFIGKWKTPLLVIHGEKDFRVPIGQGMEAFTAAQVEGIPSRFLYYPSEGHWILSPQNGVLWHRVFFDWLGRYCGEK